MNIGICTDCVLSNETLPYPTLPKFAPTDCDTFYAGSSEAKQWILTSWGCATSTDGYYTPYCDGHFANAACDGCGDPLPGMRYCYTAAYVSARVEV